MKSRPSHVAPLRGTIAPIHRGPGAHAQHQAPLTTPLVHHAPNAALLIDFDNVTMGIRSDLGHELRNLLGSDIIKGKVAVQRAYADWRRYPQYIVPLAESSIDMIMAPAYGSSKKNATDIRLAIDAMELVFTRPEIGTYILLSGDSDFSSLVMKIKEYGKYVIGVGIRESSSDLLVQNCDEYYSYNALAGLVKATDETDTQKYDPWELVSEAIARMQRNGDVMRSDRLKQVMKEIDSSFDEKDLGMSKFSKFCTEAAQKGLITVTKLENGQLEVGPPRGGKPAADAPAAAPAPRAPLGDGDDREGRRRGRRGGRGRGRRDRDENTAGLEVTAERSIDMAEEVAAPVVPAAALVVPATPAAKRHDAPRHETPRHEPRRERHAPVAVNENIGRAGLRLTRDEAFALVREAVNAVVTGDDAVNAEMVRERAFAILGRDSESLSERNFARILRDAHDGDIIDLRKRGDSFEVAKAASAPSVAAQLEVKEAALKAVDDERKAAASPPPPRGMAARGIPSRGGRGPRGPKVGAIAPDMLLIGVVPTAPVAAAPAAAEPAAAAPAKKGRGKAKPADAAAPAVKRAPRAKKKGAAAS
ncbi:MAG: NYN domain-containing protein [Gemmatimonadetes bacterium]|nr:NYN domain-containing protein [Gemmatimonadota bacterium]MBI3567587.1 NYN domain-containing protein [Gemmatimonadota bacterium]